MAARRILIAMLLALLLAAPAAAHSGGTDAQGGHYVGGTSEYHHHGYPAHQHPDGVCPYDFDDRTGERSGSSGSSRSAVVKTSSGKRGALGFGATAVIIAAACVMSKKR